MSNHTRTEQDTVYITRFRGGWAVNLVTVSGTGWQSTRLFQRGEAQAAGEVLADFLGVQLEVGGAR